MAGGRGRGLSAVAAGVGPNSAVTKYTLWFAGSSAMVRAPRYVAIVSTSENFVGKSSCAMVSVPSPHDANA
jgi:hypothetical protein